MSEPTTCDPFDKNKKGLVIVAWRTCNKMLSFFYDVAGEKGKPLAVVVVDIWIFLNIFFMLLYM